MYKKGDPITIAKVDGAFIEELRKKLKALRKKNLPLPQTTSWIKAQIKLVQNSVGKTAVVARVLEGDQVTLSINDRYITINMDCIEPA